MIVTNTLTGKKESLTTLSPNKVLLYVCGVTPYDDAHIGHGRCYVSFDLLYRFLPFLGYEVEYCRNFTDIDDKLINRAQKELGDGLRYAEIASRYIERYSQDMAHLNCLSPLHEPRVTDNISAIIDFIKGLVDAGKAYVVGGDVYYSVDAFPEYGKLSKQKLEDLRAGERVEVNTDKKNPLDFALWKSEKEGTFWSSPWGYGRPGWHIECSALAGKFLGKHIDIHCGGADLIFPHHENEIAQSEGLYGEPFSQYWLHVAFVRVNKEKMSKSLGNFFTLREVFKKFDPMVVRFYYLTHQYRTPMDFAFDDIEATQKSYQRLALLFDRANDERRYTPQEMLQSPVVAKMVEALKDDLNTSAMLAALHEHRADLEHDTHQLVLVKQFLQDVCGLQLKPLAEESAEITPEIQALLDAREAARVAKDWAKADALRDQLVAMGVKLHDKKS